MPTNSHVKGLLCVSIQFVGAIYPVNLDYNLYLISSCMNTSESAMAKSVGVKSRTSLFWFVAQIRCCSGRFVWVGRIG